MPMQRQEAAGRNDIRVAVRRQLDKADIVDVTQMHPVSMFETLCPLVLEHTRGLVQIFNYYSNRFPETRRQRHRVLCSLESKFSG